jgi:organic hydroperoxide reductase OsmC/OhrA
MEGAWRTVETDIVMKALPHFYSVTAVSGVSGDLSLTSAGMPALTSAAPSEFDGPGNQWSPESLLAAALAGCFALTFRAVARASKLPWEQLECHVEATLDRVGGVLQFTRVVTRALLTVPPGTSTTSCERALTKAEEGCLIANSLRCRRELQMEIGKAVLDRPQPAPV